MRLSTISIMSFAAAAICGLATPVAAQSYKTLDTGGTAPTRELACQKAKQGAPIMARNHGGTLTKMSECRCTDQFVSKTTSVPALRWVCIVDYTFKTEK